MAKTKIFRVAVEGDTVDGRKIERNWLVEAAQTYNTTTYGARVNMEHIRGVTADKPFKTLGDVVSLSTEEVELEIGGKKKKLLALNAEIDAHDDLVAMNRDRQKIFTSIEIQPNFANSNKAYLVGLAVTDSPASLGTEALTFAVKNPGVFRNGPQKQHQDNVFSVGLETSFELAEAEAGKDDGSAGVFGALSALITKLTKAAPDPAPAPTPPTPPADVANDNDTRFAVVAETLTAIAGTVETLSKDVRGGLTKLQGDHDALKASLEISPKPNTFNRNPSTGSGGEGRARAEF